MSTSTNCKHCGAAGHHADEVIALDLPLNEASHIFVRETGSSYFAATAYLPKVEIPNCVPCSFGEAHAHPNKPRITEAELQAAISARHQDAYEEAYDL
jgi:hypothetical protein